MTDPLHCDYVGLGSAAGCIVARRLAGLASSGVEAGDPRPYIALTTIGNYHA